MENISEISADGIYRSVKMFLQPIKFRKINIMMRSWNYSSITFKVCMARIYNLMFFSSYMSDWSYQCLLILDDEGQSYSSLLGVQVKLRCIQTVNIPKYSSQKTLNNSNTYTQYALYRLKKKQRMYSFINFSTRINAEINWFLHLCRTTCLIMQIYSVPFELHSNVYTILNYTKR